MTETVFFSVKSQAAERSSQFLVKVAMLSRFPRPTGSGLSAVGAKLVRCVSGKAAHKTIQSAVCSPVGKLTEEIFQREDKFGAHNYHPLPVALCKAYGQSTLRHYTAYRVMNILCNEPIQNYIIHYHCPSYITISYFVSCINIVTIKCLLYCQITSRQIKSFIIIVLDPVLYYIYPALALLFRAGLSIMPVVP